MKKQLKMKPRKLSVPAPKADAAKVSEWASEAPRLEQVPASAEPQKPVEKPVEAKPEATVYQYPQALVRRKAPEEKWEHNNKRASFYCPNDLLDLLQVEVAKGERTKSGIIVEAIRAHLAAG